MEKMLFSPDQTPIINDTLPIAINETNIVLKNHKNRQSADQTHEWEIPDSDENKEFVLPNIHCFITFRSRITQQHGFTFFQLMDPIF